MAFDAGAVANYMLDLATRDGLAISPMKLQKLLYFAHGWHLALTGGEPLLDEHIEAWKWGPVVSSVYHEFKEFGSGPIDGGTRVTELKSVRVADGTRLRIVERQIEDRGAETSKAKSVIGRVWDVYKNYTAVQLSNMTHQPGSPWYEVWEGMGPVKKKGKDIPDELITKHFLSMMHRGA